MNRILKMACCLSAMAAPALGSVSTSACTIAGSAGSSTISSQPLETSASLQMKPQNAAPRSMVKSKALPEKEVYAPATIIEWKVY